VEAAPWRRFRPESRYFIGSHRVPLTAAFTQRHTITLSYEPSASRRADAALNFTGQRAKAAPPGTPSAGMPGLPRLGEDPPGRQGSEPYYFSDSGFSSLHGGLSRARALLPVGHSLSAPHTSVSVRSWEAAVPDLRLIIKYGLPLNIPWTKAGSRGHSRTDLPGGNERAGEGAGLAPERPGGGHGLEGRICLPSGPGRQAVLQIDRERMPADLIPNRPVPIEVDVTEGVSRLDIGLVRAGEVTGTVVGYGLPEEASSFVVGQSPSR